MLMNIEQSLVIPIDLDVLVDDFDKIRARRYPLRE